MPILLREAVNSNSQIAVWEMTEDPSFFLSKLSLPEKLQEKNPSLKSLHKLATRVLMDELLGVNKHKDLHYDDYGQPLLQGSNIHLSISHSRQRVALIISSKKVGIDIEFIRPKIVDIAPKFMSTVELSSFSKEHFIEHLHVYWGAKESLYKLYGKKGLIFKEQLLLEPFEYNESGRITGSITIGSISNQVQMTYRKLGEYMLVYTHV